MRINNSHRTLSNVVIKAGIIAVFVTGMFISLEWIALIFFPNAAISPSMRLTTAGLFVLASLSLWLFLSQNSWKKHVLRITGWIILMVSLLTLLTYFQGNAAHRHDYLLFNFFLKTDNRMAFFTTVIFLWLGIILILFASNSRTQDDIAHVFIFPTFSMSYFAIICYILGVSDVFRIAGLTIASSTAFCFFLLCIVLLLLKPDTWLMRILKGAGPGSIMGRRLLPWLLILPIVIAWIRIQLEPQGYLSTGVSAVVIAVAYSLSFILLVWWSGLHVNRIDQKRQQAHEALRENRARLNALIMATSDGVYSMSPDWQQMIRMEGRDFLASVERPIDDWLINFIPVETQSMVLEEINRAITTKSKFELEHKVIRQDGSIGWTLSRAIPVLDKSGEIMEWLGIAHDITERKNTELALLTSEKTLSDIYNSMSEGLSISQIIYDAEGKAVDFVLIDANPAFERITGQKVNDIKGIKASERYSTPIAPFLDIWARVASSGEPIHFETYFPPFNKYLSASAFSPEKGKFAVLFRDVTERKRNEEVLAFQAQLLSEVNDAVFSSDSNFTLTYWNQSAEKMFGWTQEEVLGHPSGELLKPTIDASTVDKERWRLKNEGSWIGEGKFMRKDGTYFFAEINSKTLKDADGKYAGQIVAARDITERKRVEEELRESEEKYRRIIETANEGIILGEPDGTITFVNRKMADMLGYSVDEIIGKSGLNFLAEDQKEKVLANRTKLKKNGDIKDDFCFRRKDGSLLWTICSTAPIINSKGEHTGNIAMHTDISDRKRAEEVSAFQSRLLSEVNDAVFSSDPNFMVTYWNQAAEKMFGWTKEEVLGHDSGKLLNPKTNVSSLEEVRSKLKNEGYWIGEWQLVRKDGTSFFAEINSKTLKDAEGKYAGQIIVARDITERKQAQAEIIAAKEKAEESDRLKSAFLANMSHELRTPLNSIIGFSDLMMDPFFDSNEKSKYSEIINTSGNNLLMIINDIMDISKIEAGQVQVINQMFSVSKLITELKEEYSLKANQKGIEIILDPLSPAEEVFIESDRTKIRQILVNLVGNAIKFTEKGFVGLGWKINGNLIEFHVKDTGIGVSADYQTQIFERFRQVESSETRKYGGTGLGLAISKSLTELLGGTIWMESIEGEGSTFYFTVPVHH
jgi:PAS domain S-box-containing protein